MSEILWVYKLPEKLKETEMKIVDGVEQSVESTVDNPFSGSVTLKLMSASERLRAYKNVQFRVNDVGELVKRDSMEMAPEILDLAEAAIKEMAVKRIEDGYEFTNAAELSVDEIGFKLLVHIGHKILNGVKLGKDSPLQLSSK